MEFRDNKSANAQTTPNPVQKTPFSVYQHPHHSWDGKGPNDNTHVFTVTPTGETFKAPNPKKDTHHTDSNLNVAVDHVTTAVRSNIPLDTPTGSPKKDNRQS